MLERGRPELQWRTILAGVAGNVMEWYDFSVYGYFAAVIFDVLIRLAVFRWPACAALMGFGSRYLRG